MSHLVIFYIEGGTPLFSLPLTNSELEMSRPNIQILRPIFSTQNLCIQMDKYIKDLTWLCYYDTDKTIYDFKKNLFEGVISLFGLELLHSMSYFTLFWVNLPPPFP